MKKNIINIGKEVINIENKGLKILAKSINNKSSSKLYSGMKSRVGLFIISLAVELLKLQFHI